MKRASTMDVSQCAEIQEILSAKLDGEALPDELVAVSEHLENCVDCVAYEAELVEMNAGLAAWGDGLIAGFDSAQLWQRIQSDIDRIDNGSRWDTSLARWLGTVAVAACLIISVTVTSFLVFSPGKTLLPVVAETVRDFQTFQVRGELLDVNVVSDLERDMFDSATNSATGNAVEGAIESVVKSVLKSPAKNTTGDVTSSQRVVEWMSARVNFVLPEMVNPPAGYTLSGGRLCSFLNRRLAFFQYQKNSDQLSLYVMQAKGLELPERGRYETATTADGLTTVTWTRDQLVYVAVSEMAAGEIVDFASRT